MSDPDSQTDRRSLVIGGLQIAGIVAIIALALVLTRLLAADDAPQARPSAGEAIAVEVMEPRRGRHRVEVGVTGVVEAPALANITPQVSGRIVDASPSARPGAAFEAGETLFRIDPRDFQVAVERAQAALADAQSALRQAEAEAEVAREEWRAVYPEAEIQPLAAREPQLEAARSRVKSAEADLSNARLNLERTRYDMPFRGRVIDSRIEEGQLVSAGQSFGTVYDIDGLEVVAPVSPTQLRRLGAVEGRPARVISRDGAWEMAGAIDRVGARHDPRSRLIDLYVSVDSPERVRPGEFVEVSIDGPVYEEVAVLPAGALAGASSVRVVNADGAIEERAVVIIDRPPDFAIVEPFDAGQGVIVSPVPEGAKGRSAQIVDRVDGAAS